jgi:predicted ATP-grasp superfamily ATP-dependent carboligase
VTVSEAQVQTHNEGTGIMASTYHPDPNVGVVVVGAELNGLGVARSLASQRVPIIAVDTKNTRTALWSRYVRAHLIKSFTGRAFVDDMIELGKTFDQPPILILTDEDAVHSLSEGRDALSKWFRFRLPSDDTVDMLASKARFHEFSSKHGFPVPRSVILEKRSDVELLSQLRYPCVLKPDDKRNVLRGVKERAVRVESLNFARDRAMTMLATPGGIVAQEWIEGPESNIHFTLFYRGAGGKMVGMFTGRKILCSPPHIGNTAVCVAAPPQAREVLEPMTASFADHAGFDGMGSIEYKWDDNYRQFAMVEPTVGRTDWQEEIATLCGVNIPLAAYRHELGLPPVPDQSRGTPVAWRATLFDQPPRHLLSAHTKIVDGYFRWDDPFPAFHFYCLLNPLRRIKRRWKAVKAPGWQQRKA